MRRDTLCDISNTHTHIKTSHPLFLVRVAQSEVELQKQLVEVGSLIDVCVFESDAECSFFVLCSQLYLLLIQQSLQTNNRVVR